MVKVNNMARTQISEKLGSNGSVFDHSVPSNVHRSRFDLSYKKMFTADIGMIMPIDLIRTLPGDDFEISVDYLLDTLPMVAPPMTNYRVVTHWYYCRLIDLWEGAETFITRGRSGTIDLEIPTLSIKVSSGDSSTYFSSIDNMAFYNSPMSLSCFLGLPPLYYNGINSSGSTVSLYNYLPCIPSGLLNSDYDLYEEDEDTVSVATGLHCSDYVNALPFFMYQKIYRQNYLANNLMQDNKVWFPDNLSETWRINYSASNLMGLYNGEGAFAVKHPCNLFVPNVYDVQPNGLSNLYLSPSNIKASAFFSESAYESGDSSTYPIYGNTVPKITDTCVNLLQLRYAMWRDDYFTTALPWSTRGTSPTIENGLTGYLPAGLYNDSEGLFAPVLLGMHTSSSNITDSGDLPSEFTTAASLSAYSDYRVNGDSVTGSDGYSFLTSSSYPGIIANPGLGFSTDSDTASSVFGTASGSISGYSSYYINKFAPLGVQASDLTFSISANTLRNLLALSVWQERNARTNGNYNSTIFAHFRVNPHSNDYEPKYIGGTADYIQFSKVIQTSATDVDNDSYLGSEAGLGSVHSSGFVGRFHSNDYGYIMGVMIITPEVSYSGGIDRLWFETTADEQYFPEYASLGLQEIYNKEIYVAEDDETQDNDLFGYQERYTYYKTRRNQVSGLFALTPDSDLLFSAYVQNRYFDSLPELSQQFVTMHPLETRRDFLAYPSQPAFRIQLANKVYAVRALPYQNIPQTFGF